MSGPACGLAALLAGAPPPPAPAAEESVETEHFAVSWPAGDDLSAAAGDAAEALEAAWTALVDEGGWPPPPGMDAGPQPVRLDPELDGTGLTWMDEVDGVERPVIALDPAWDAHPDFFAELAAHEFVHALQYGLRDPGAAVGAIDEETWCWEASAEWGAAGALDAGAVVAEQSAAYAERPEARYTELDGGHAYGMFLLHAWIEEAVGGPEALRDLWLLAAGRPDSAWDAILAEQHGVSAGALWAGFSAAYGNRQLADNALYAIPASEAAVPDGAAGSLAYLGTRYYDVDVAEARIAPEGAVIVSGLAGAAGEGETLLARGGTRVAVTGLDPDGADYVLHVERRVRRPGDPEDRSAGNGLCAATAPARGPLAWALAWLVAARRRRLQRPRRG